MRCPHCGQLDTKVIDSRPGEEGALLRRRRLCDACGLRFTTHERILRAPLMVVKKDGRREELSPEKLRSGIAKACNKRSVATADIDKLVDEVAMAVRSEPGSEVQAEHIGELVMERLFNLDEVAYVRFASVYQRFDDVRRFAQLLERISRRARQRPTAERGPGERQMVQDTLAEAPAEGIAEAEIIFAASVTLPN